ncbi:MAG TPA: hypothetical protein DCE35_00140, partial [Alcanivorax sp.]|nr:hypothetical protein [Alcanivorax sp.]
ARRPRSTATGRRPDPIKRRAAPAPGVAPRRFAGARASPGPVPPRSARAGCPGAGPAGPAR